MGKGSTNKRKGSNAERYYATIFKEELGFSFCQTSRYTSKILDDAGVDLNFLPFNIQIKAGYARGLNEFKTLKIIEERLPLLFPPYDIIHKKVNILIHKKDVGRGKKKKDTHELVFFWKKDFSKLFPDYNFDYPLITKEGQKRGWTFEEILHKHEMFIFKQKKEELIVMTFNTFKKLIKNRIKEWQ